MEMDLTKRLSGNKIIYLIVLLGWAGLLSFLLNNPFYALSMPFFFIFMGGPVKIEDGVWVGAKSVICLGVTLKTHSVINTGSVVTKDTEPFTVYQGNPAQPIRERSIG